MSEVKVSVLIPVYNTSKTLAQCLDSVIRQTMKEIEIICVDDGSDEETKAILCEYSQKDARIKVIAHAANQGLLYARKTAIEAACAPYCMILDSDDEFYPQACERAWRVIENKKADIVHFGTEVIFDDFVTESERIAMTNCLRVKKGALYGKKIFETFLTFGGKNSGFNVWSKIYRRELLLCAAQFIPKERCVMAEDFALTFMVLFRTEKYYGIADKLIRYHFGSGISAPHVRSLKRYADFIERETACRAVREFLDQNHPDDPVYQKSLFEWREDFFKGNIWSFITDCPKVLAPQVFDLLVKAYGAKDVVTEIVKIFGTGQTGALAKKVAGAVSLNADARPIKTVGFFYFRYFNGGVERVMSVLIPRFMQWGYRVVLFVEQEGKEEYPLPEGCEKVVLPPSICQGYEKYAEHVGALLSALKQYEVDALLYQAASSEYLLYDLIAVKSYGIRFYVSVHECFVTPLLYGTSLFANRFSVLRLADGVQTLLKSDEKFLNACGIRAQYIPNPQTYPVSEEISLQTSNIVWVGRLEESVKRPSDALYIMKEVVRRIPKAHLLIVGSSGSEETDEGYRRLADELGIGKNVTFCGFRKDPKDFYEACSVLLLTSVIESWCMVLVEGMSCGLPVVAYEMPYLETLRNNTGCVCVEQGDIRGAAESIVALLKDENLRSEKARGALQAARSLAGEDLQKYWEKLFSATDRDKTCDQDMRIALETMFDFYGRHYSNGREANIIRIGLLYLREHGVRATLARVRLFIKKYGFKETLHKIFGRR